MRSHLLIGHGVKSADYPGVSANDYHRQQFSDCTAGAVVFHRPVPNVIRLDDRRDGHIDTTLYVKTTGRKPALSDVQTWCVINRGASLMYAGSYSALIERLDRSRRWQLVPYPQHVPARHVTQL